MLFIGFVYREVKDSSNKNMVNYSTSGRGPLHCLPVNTQYKPLGMLDQKRLIARKYGTTYCYDFPLAFEAALAKLWIQHPGIKKPTDKAILRVTEFIFADRDAVWLSPLVSVERKPGFNDIGLVAWRMEMSTPEFPSWRTIIVICNDVNFKSGSFGPEENAFFMAVINFACSHKLQLIYLAATSGSRIAMEDEVKSCFKVGWFNESNPQDGFEYVYFTPEDYSRIGSHVIAHELKLPNGEIRWVIDTILGKVDSDAVMKEGDLVADAINGTGAIARAYLRA